MKKEKNITNENEEITLLEALNQITEKARRDISSLPKSEFIRNETNRQIEYFFYNQLFKMFLTNLSLPISEEFYITNKIKKEINKKFKNLFEDAYKNLAVRAEELPEDYSDHVFDFMNEFITDNGFDIDGFLEHEEERDELVRDDMIGISQKTYETFREDLKKIDENAFKFLSFIESELNIGSCKKEIAKFKDEIKDLGLDFTMELDSDNELSVSLGFDDYDDD